MAEAGHGRLAVLISGRGTNLGAFIDACAANALKAEIGIVIANNPTAPGLALASAAGIPTQVVNHRDYADRESFDAALVDALEEHSPDLVILAGFMRILTPVFVEAFKGRLMNIHPSLLPKYPGLNTHQRALDAGDTQAGVTVHFVTLELDGGPPIVQAQVPIESGDTAERLAARVNREELVIYPLAARWFLEGRLRLNPAGAELDGDILPPTGVTYGEELLASA